MASFSYYVRVLALHVLATIFLLADGADVSELNLLPRYDFIIIGAGSAGSVVANRLSENNKTNVLLIEAGGEKNYLIEMPTMAFNLIGSDKDWMIKTEEQTSDGFWGTNKTLLYTRGKVLGGSSAVNWMLYTRGNEKDYDDWNEAVGGGWSWQNDVLPAFLKFEDCQFNSTDDKEYHHTGGELTVTETDVANSMSDVFFEVGKELGLTKRDTNGRIQSGIMRAQNTIRNGVRCSAEKAFLEPVRKRTNLHIVTEAEVTKVVFAYSSAVNMQRATGVEFVKNGTTYKATSAKEVILSAGAVKSPQLLLLSGVGPKAQLDQFGIKVVADLPGVGENFRDHILQNTIVYTKRNNAMEAAKCPTDSNFQAGLREWGIYHKGPLATPVIDVLAYLKSSQANKSEDRPDFLVGFSPPVTVYGPGNEAYSAIKCISAMIGARSSGFVKLRSKNPLEPPIFNPRYLRDPFDVKLMIEGTQWCLSLEDTEAFKKAGLTLDPAALADCAKKNKTSDDYAHCVGLHDIFPGMHGAGTCKMGIDSDKMAVVDKELKVFKVFGLRVIDTSIMPMVIKGTTNAAAMMIGERGAHFLKQLWKI